MPISLSLTVSADTLTIITQLSGAALTATTPVSYTLYYPGGLAMTQPLGTFSGLPNGDYAIRGSITDDDGTVEEDYQEFTVDASTVPAGAGSTPVVFTVTTEPGFLQATANPIRWTVTKTRYAIGQLFFCEVWSVPSSDVQLDTPKVGASLLRTLTVNGPGDGSATFDISSVLATKFRHDTQFVPNPLLAFQTDSTCYHPYFVKMGYITYNTRNEQIKVYKHESDVKVGLRAALPLEASGDMPEYYYQFDGETHRYLTSIPDGAKRRRSEDTFLSVFHARNPEFLTPDITVKADLVFTDGSIDTGYIVAINPITTGGVFIVNVRPQFLVAHPRYSDIAKYSIYLTYTQEQTNDNPDYYSVTMTQSREFSVTPDIQTPVGLMFMNRLGSWDTLQFRRNSESEIKTKSAFFTSALVTRTYQVDATTTITYHSPWLNQEEYEWLKDLITSPGMYINGRYRRGNDMTYKLDSSLGLFTLDITVQPDVDENSIKL